jgi:anion-transporting  ArsA/GET3 family ATPase
VNKVIPEHVEGSFMRNRKEAERPYLEEIKQVFKDIENVYVPMVDYDIATREGLEEYSQSSKKQNCRMDKEKPARTLCLMLVFFVF